MERKLLTGPVQTVSPSTMPPRALPSWHPHQNSREGWDFKPNPSTDSCRKPIASMCTMLGAGRSIRRFRFQDSTSRDLQVQGSKELQFNRYSWIIRSTVCTGCGALQKPDRKLCKVCGKQFGSHVSNGSPWPASKSQPTVRTVSDPYRNPGSMAPWPRSGAPTQISARSTPDAPGRRWTCTSSCSNVTTKFEAETPKGSRWTKQCRLPPHSGGLYASPPVM